MNDERYRQELIWTLRCVDKNQSALSCDGIGDTFKYMCGTYKDGHGVADDFSIGKTKFGYIVVEALGPYFRKLMLEEAAKAYYSLCFDETTNEKGFKEQQVAIRFWSDVSHSVQTRHLETFFIGHATSEILLEYLRKAHENANIPLKI